ncbi:MAG TPA: metallophosphoesterase [Fibrobacter sp.]|nr:metallophosphoesterase [Fibrobacter sp.]
MIDFIGDIHGHADRLEALLKKLGYSLKMGVYRHPSRRVVFLGDYLDRGPDARGTVRIVRAMVEAGEARAIIGNHELNMLCFWTPNAGGGYLRDHSINKILIHAETIRSYQHYESEFREMLDWLYTLPLYIETDFFRAQHACFDTSLVDVLKSENITSVKDESTLRRMVNKRDPLFKPVDSLLKGPEMALPQGISYRDKEGVLRTRTRVCWWENPATAPASDLFLQTDFHLPNMEIPAEIRKGNYYHESERPVFFGHYWFDGEVRILKPNVCCLDYSVASYKNDGKLVAYRFDGESVLNNNRFVYV